MKKRIKILTKGWYKFFRDIRSQDKLYCVSQEIYDENDIYLDFDIEIDGEPIVKGDYVTIRVFPLEKVGSDQTYDYYDFDQSKYPVLFQVNKIEWIQFYYDPNE